MVRYWCEFDFNNYKGAIPPGLLLGCGITALSNEHALVLLKSKVFKHDVLPKISSCLENVHIRALDQLHVVPNMKAPIYIGVWFPIGYD